MYTSSYAYHIHAYRMMYTYSMLAMKGCLLCILIWPTYLCVSLFAETRNNPANQYFQYNIIAL